MGISNFLDEQADKINATENKIKVNGGNPDTKLPYFISGSRSYIRIAGKAIGVAMSVQWQLSAPGTEIRTIDTHIPWDITPNQMSISATLSKIMDPRKSPESLGLFHTMQSIIHQPYVEIQIVDAKGSNIMWAKGMFTAMSNSISAGQLGNITANFQGVAYQGNVFQEFTPYPTDVFAKAGELAGTAFGIAKKFSGGFL